MALEKPGSVYHMLWLWGPCGEKVIGGWDRMSHGNGIVRANLPVPQSSWV